MLEKSVLVDGINVNYKVADPPSLKASEGLREVTPLVILHGWGSSSDSWVEAMEMLASEGYQVVVPDLPGFGKTLAPNEVWGVEEYAHFVAEFAGSTGLEKFVLAGHSFGGQTAIQFAVDYPEKVEKLILMSAAGVRRTPGFAKKFVMFVAKLVSFLLYIVPFQDLRNNIRNAAYMLIHRRDYGKAQGIMRDIFKKVISQDLTAKFSKIQAPTLILWGEKDELTPVQDAHLMKELIPNSELKVFPNTEHSLNFEIPEELSKTIVRFI